MKTMMMRAALAGACAMSLGACATSYGQAGLLGGYSERQIEPGLWRVQGQSNGFSRPDAGFNMALYRAAELAEGAGFSHFQVVDANVRVTVLTQYGQPMGSGGERARLRIRGVNSADAPIECEMKEALCRTFAVSEVIAQLGPVLNIRRRAQTEPQAARRATGATPPAR